MNLPKIGWWTAIAVAVFHALRVLFSSNSETALRFEIKNRLQAMEASMDSFHLIPTHHIQAVDQKIADLHARYYEPYERSQNDWDELRGYEARLKAAKQYVRATTRPREPS